MSLSKRTSRAIVLALSLSAVGGCAAPITTAFVSGSRRDDLAIESTDVSQSGVSQPGAPTDQSAAATGASKATDPIAEAALKKATGQSAATPEQAFGSVLKELQEIRALDPQAEQQLMADLQAAKPEHYPMIVQTFRNALAYRKQLAAREHGFSGAEQLAGGAVHAHSSMNHSSSVDRASHDALATRRERRREERRATAEVVASDDDGQFQDERPPVRPLPARVDQRSTQASVYEQVPQREVDRRAEVVAPTEGPRRKPLVAAATASDSESDNVSQASHAEPVRHRDAGRQSLGAGNHTRWQQELEDAIEDLQASVSEQPASVDELHDHMRLRTLQLLAGHDEAAYEPIPGASPEQQDYWAKQLFAMASYLDGATKLDDKQRAAAALGPLDEARAKLSELATLQIRNLTFVEKESVDGFGSYKPVKMAEFQPGQQVTVYAEVENFRSHSTKEGYETSLGTSYQVLDKGGQRVAGSKFPDVADTCRNRRRDFHLQYGIALPTQIYAGEYRLEVTITDHQSGKIGTSTLPFVIGAER